MVLWIDYACRGMGIGRNDDKSDPTMQMASGTMLGNAEEMLNAMITKDARTVVVEWPRKNRQKPVSKTSNLCAMRQIGRKSDPVLVHSGRECNAKRQY